MSGMNWVRCHEQVRARRFLVQMPAIDFDCATAPRPLKAIHNASRMTLEIKAHTFAQLQSYIAAFNDRRSRRSFNAAREVAMAMAKVLQQCERLGPDFTRGETELLLAARALTARQAV
jgi:hypothetical protein